MRIIYWLALLLAMIGALNWGLVGLFNLDIIAYLFGNLGNVAKIIYLVIGGAGVYLLISSFGGGLSQNR